MAFHFLVDLLCGAAVLGPAAASLPTARLGALVALYNSLAFCTQWLTGLLCDRLRQDRRLLFVSCGTLLAGGALTPAAPWTGTVLLGLGNSLFHTAAGREAIRQAAQRAPDRSWPLGAFVAPGALGITLGCLFPTQLYPAAVVALLLQTVLFALLQPKQIPEDKELLRHIEDKHITYSYLNDVAIVLILFCVLCRAAAGGGGPRQDLLLAAAGGIVVMAGKLAGGAVADRLGLCRTGLLALAGAWALLTWGAGDAGLALTAQFVANLMMAVTLFLLVSLRPRQPGLMFGLAATALYPGALLARHFGPGCLGGLHAAAIASFALACALRAPKRRASG